MGAGRRQLNFLIRDTNDPIDKPVPKDGLLGPKNTVAGSVGGSRMFRANGRIMKIHSRAGAFGMGGRRPSGTAIANPQRKV
ncbi:hypothetical protein ACVGX7_00055, partial [Enterobacter hormaechei]